MCGIAGVLNFDQSPVSTELLERMGATMQHRGPDDRGTFSEQGVGLAHQRLSILDLSPSGHQPMISDERRFAIVYNGECYNYLELRKELEARGCRFRSATDTEVVLNGIREFGPDFVKRMVGMFAFAIWDSKTRELSLFRDRVGIKPLYYHLAQGRLVFGSEIKPLLEAGVPVELETEGLSAYFSLRYVPGETTLFRGIKKLDPGTWLRISADGQIRAETYWRLVDQAKILPLSEKQAQEQFQELLTDSLRGCMLADVPVGAFLSGGVDSALITALMKRNQDSVETFTFGMGSDIDETDRARAIAAGLGVRNTVTRLDQEDFRYYPRALWHLEEPIGDSIIVPTYLLSRSASEKVKVIELGEGADEILGSYVHQLAMTYGNLLARSIPRSLRLGGVQVLRHLPDFFWDRVFPYPAKLGRSGIEKVIDYLGNHDSSGQAYLALVGLFTESEKASLFDDELYHQSIAPHSPAARFTAFWSDIRNPDFTNGLQQLDLRYWNTDYTMLRMDKLTMAHSIEARVPYLDHRLIELCLQLPRRYKTRRFKQKLLMRGAFSRQALLPAEVLQAPKKAFYLPVEKCFDARFEQFARDTLSDEAIRRRGIFDPAQIRAIRDNPNRELIHNKQLIALLCFELWAGIFLDGNWRTAPAF